MESYEPIVTPMYNPGDEVILDEPAQGWDDAHGRVTRVVPIAPLSDSTVRYLYLLDLDGHAVPVLTIEDECLRPRWSPPASRSA
jgi:hypothetical protein